MLAGLQGYGGDLFADICDTADNTFNSLPPAMALDPREEFLASLPPEIRAEFEQQQPPAPAPAAAVICTMRL